MDSTPLRYDVASVCYPFQTFRSHYVVLKRRLPSDAASHKKNGVVKNIAAKTSRLTKIHYFNINYMLVHNLFTDTVLTVGVIYLPLRAQTDTWHEVGRMVNP